MLTRREALDEARQNIATGTSKAAALKDSAQSKEVRELANAVYWIGFGATQIANALTDEGRTNDLPLR